MRTTVSIPDDLFDSAESLARCLGISRNELFATALAEFVAGHAEDEITRRLNLIYLTEDGRLDAVFREVQRRSLAEATQEFALVAAIPDGEATDRVSRDEVFQALEDAE